jgi:hypothetical protein
MWLLCSFALVDKERPSEPFAIFQNTAPVTVEPLLAWSNLVHPLPLPTPTVGLPSAEKITANRSPFSPGGMAMGWLLILEVPDEPEAEATTTGCGKVPLKKP